MSLCTKRLYEACKSARVHGNGFIQIDLEKNKRLHIWGHPDIPRQRQASQIHDHRFGMTSRVLVGSMVNVIYYRDFDARPTHVVHTPQTREGEDTILVADGEEIGLNVSSVEYLPAGATYAMNAWQLHETFVNEPTATLMTKKPATIDYTPRVLVRIGCEPDNTFHRLHQLSFPEIWRIVTDVLGSAPANVIPQEIAL